MCGKCLCVYLSLSEVKKCLSLRAEASPWPLHHCGGWHIYNIYSHSFWFVISTPPPPPTHPNCCHGHIPCSQSDAYFLVFSPCLLPTATPHPIPKVAAVPSSENAQWSNSNNGYLEHQWSNSNNGYLEYQWSNSNNGYLEHLTCTDPECLHMH